MIQDFLAPVPESIIAQFEGSHPQQLISALHLHREIEGLPDLRYVKIALIGVMEDRGAQENIGCDSAPNEIRKYLYPLYRGSWHSQIADLGNIFKGETMADTHVALREVVSELLKKNILPIILGGSQDLTYSIYRAYDALEQMVNLAVIDSRCDLGAQGEVLNAKNFLSHIVINKPYNLYNFANIGHQTYFVNQEELGLMERMFFDVVRLGEVRASLEETEPYLRNADVVSFDISAIRQTDAPGTAYPSPHGLTGEEACSIARYAGLSDKVNCFGVFELNPQIDTTGQTAHLAAHMVWYFLEGYNHRLNDYPFTTKKDYTRFRVLIEDGDHEISFYKSPKSERWWVEVLIQAQNSHRHTLVPCSYKDYLNATKGEIPLRWWKALQKGL